MINVLDIISTVNYIMGGNPSPFNMDAADINADGGINVLDIIALVNIIMQVQGLPCGCVAPVIYDEQTYSTVKITDFLSAVSRIECAQMPGGRRVLR